MNTKVRGCKDLESLNIPFIGETPQPLIQKGKLGFSSKIQPGTRSIMMRKGSRDIVNKAFCVLRSNIDSMLGKNSRQNMFVITSLNPSSGKPFLAMNIAMSFVIKKKRILVTDSDLRHGPISSYIDFLKVGLSDYLGGRISNRKGIIIKDKQYDNLYILPIDIIPSSPTGLLEDDKLIFLVEALRNEYGYILIDCPPTDIVADAQVIEKLADRTVFVVRSGLSDRSMLPELENICQKKRFKNLGVILNSTGGVRNRYSHRHGYRYGYHNGSYYYGNSA